MTKQTTALTCWYLHAGCWTWYWHLEGCRDWERLQALLQLGNDWTTRRPAAKSLAGCPQQKWGMLLPCWTLSLQFLLWLGAHLQSSADNPQLDAVTVTMQPWPSWCALGIFLFLPEQKLLCACRGMNAVCDNYFSSSWWLMSNALDKTKHELGPTPVARRARACPGSTESP